LGGVEMTRNEIMLVIFGFAVLGLIMVIELVLAISKFGWV
jgi:hypothetical protein